MSTGYRYVPKKLTQHQLDRIEFVKKILTAEINSCKNFEDRKKAIYKGVDVLFNYITTREEYIKEERKAKHFEAEEYDIDSFGDVSLYSEECIDKVIGELGFGATSSDLRAIEKNFMDTSINSINLADLYKLAQRTMSENLDKKQLEFMKKTNFLSEFFKSQQQSENVQQNIDALKNVTQNAKNIISKNDSIISKGQIAIGDKTVSELAYDYLKQTVSDSYNRALKDSHYAPVMKSDNPDVSIVCGLPGLGKSTIFINDLKKQGYMCVDLDEIAISISKKFGVQIDDKTSSDIYTLANLIHDSVVAQGMANGYNIAVEKIGYDKKQITSISDNLYKIADEVSSATRQYTSYKQSLLMAAGSSVKSAESNAIRNAEQIFSNSDLRAYHYADLIRNNNCTTYAYLDVISDAALRERFAKIKISDRVGCFEGLGMIDGKFVALENEKQKVKTLAKPDGYGYER